MWFNVLMIFCTIFKYFCWLSDYLCKREKLVHNMSIILICIISLFIQIKMQVGATLGHPSQPIWLDQKLQWGSFAGGPQTPGQIMVTGFCQVSHSNSKYFKFKNKCLTVASHGFIKMHSNWWNIRFPWCNVKEFTKWIRLHTAILTKGKICISKNIHQWYLKNLYPIFINVNWQFTKQLITVLDFNMFCDEDFWIVLHKLIGIR